MGLYYKQLEVLVRICVIGGGGVYEKLVLAPSDEDQELSSRRK